MYLWFPVPTGVALIFLPPVMVSRRAALFECRAYVVILVPDLPGSWFPMLREARLRDVYAAAPGAQHVFLLGDALSASKRFNFRRRGVRAVEGDYGRLGQTSGTY